ncbi:MAG: aldo/keto reductase [Rhodobacter sp.]|nr:aldo/keto reductase [Rhodobacter sp.]
MQQRPLGQTGLRGSGFCLGTMTRGTQADAAGVHDQINPALEHGVTFRDTAAMHPANPVPAETAGRPEEIIGRRIAKGGPRDRVVLATRVAGAGQGAPRLSGPLPRTAGRGAETACARRGDGAL